MTKTITCFYWPLAPGLINNYFLINLESFNFLTILSCRLASFWFYKVGVLTGLIHILGFEQLVLRVEIKMKATGHFDNKQLRRYICKLNKMRPLMWQQHYHQSVFSKVKKNNTNFLKYLFFWPSQSNPRLDMDNFNITLQSFSDDSVIIVMKQTQSVTIHFQQCPAKISLLYSWQPQKTNHVWFFMFIFLDAETCHTTDHSKCFFEWFLSCIFTFLLHYPNVFSSTWWCVL